MPDKELHAYSYSTRPPNHRHSILELEAPVGHRMGMKVRRDRLVPGPEAYDYQSYCTCGWRQGKGQLTGFSPIWVRPKANAAKYWSLHIQAVRRQGSLL